METADLKRLIEKPREVTFWGQKHTVTPAFVSDSLGDGKKLLFVTPLATRPNWYVVRVDSSWDINNFGNGELVCEHLEEILFPIEKEYGLAWYDEDDNELEVRRPFPALSEDCGVAWGEEEWPSPSND